MMVFHTTGENESLLRAMAEHLAASIRGHRPGFPYDCVW